ncbi:MAG: Slp family lipoprotein [Pseudomonadota bacterium]
MKKICLLILLAGLSACAVVPDEIAVNEGAQLVNFESVSTLDLKPPQSGQMARWGGEIVKVENKPDHSEIEIVFYDAQNTGKPNIGKNSPGRFIAVVPGFIDPLVIESGRLITVVGNIGNNIQGQIGEQNYRYPSIETQGYYVWQKTSEVEIEGHYTPSIYGPRTAHRGFSKYGWITPWYDPFWQFPTRQRVRVKHKDGGAIGERVKDDKENDDQ